jgi:hypothetical protein
VKRKLISSNEATPAPRQLTKPCSDCPWARDALNGWLGGNTAHEWIIMAHDETLIDCHVHPNVQCAGAAIYRANVRKRTREPETLKLPRDEKICFATPLEFLAHHTNTPENRLRAKLLENIRQANVSLQDNDTNQEPGGRPMDKQRPKKKTTTSPAGRPTAQERVLAMNGARELLRAVHTANPWTDDEITEEADWANLAYLASADLVICHLYEDPGHWSLTTLGLDELAKLEA